MTPPVVAVHHNPGSFSDRWLEFLAERQIEHRIVNCLDTDLIPALDGVSCLLWHFHHVNLNDLNYARSILHAAQKAGVAVFPDLDTCVHFDDKVAQKFLLEAVSAPTVPTWVFFERQQAEAWIQTATFPKVFKLRRGAGASNVRLVQDRREAHKLCKIAFGAGFQPLPHLVGSTLARKQAGLEATSPRDVVKGLVKKLLGRPSVAPLPRERGYLYFQEFVPDNEHDIRVTVIGGRAFCFRRDVRSNDFRASGSGKIVHYEPGQADAESLEVALRIASRLKAQSVAFDILIEPETGRRVILEISYGYLAEPVRDCGGYYDRRLGWHPGVFWPQDLILEDLLQSAG